MNLIHLYYRFKYRKSGATAIAVIRGNNKSKFDEKLKIIENEITPCFKANSDVIKLLREKYELVEYSLSDSELTEFKINYILSHKPELLATPELSLPQSRTPKADELKAFTENYDKRFAEARNYPFEKLNLRINSYLLKLNLSNNLTIDIKIICEENSNELFGRTSSINTQLAEKEHKIIEKVMDEIILTKGISADDIAEKGRKYINYSVAYMKSKDKYMETRKGKPLACVKSKISSENNYNPINEKHFIIAIVIVSCIIMGLLDAVIQPNYIIKSLVKIPLFLILPLICCKLYKDRNLKKVLVPSKKGFTKALVVGALVFAVIMGAYILLKDVFDFSNVTTSLTGDIGVTKENFIWVAIHISFVNSFLEEFFFRGFSFIILKEKSNPKFAYIFSSLAFALYHIAMMIGWFDWYVIALAIFGLVIGAIIFNYFDEKNENIYMSWLIHMFANFAINTIGFMLFEII